MNIVIDDRIIDYTAFKKREIQRIRNTDRKENTTFRNIVYPKENENQVS